MVSLGTKAYKKVIHFIGSKRCKRSSTSRGFHSLLADRRPTALQSSLTITDAAAAAAAAWDHG